MNSAVLDGSNIFRRSAALRELGHVHRVITQRGLPVRFGGAPHGLTRKALEAAGLAVSVTAGSWRVERWD